MVEVSWFFQCLSWVVRVEVDVGLAYKYIYSCAQA